MDARHLFDQLEQRRARLDMSKSDLARRAGVSVPTVNRLLSGREPRARTDVVSSIAAALGVEVRLGAEPSVHELTDAIAFKRAQAKKKARWLTSLVQGTMALEAEAVDPTALAELEEQNVHALVAGSGRRLWGA